MILGSFHPIYKQTEGSSFATKHRPFLHSFSPPRLVDFMSNVASPSTFGIKGWSMTLVSSTTWRFFDIFKIISWLIYFM